LIRPRPSRIHEPFAQSSHFVLLLMRLLHVIHTVNPASGGPAAAVSLFVRFATGAQHEVATLDDPQSPWTKDYPCPLHSLGPGLLTYGYSRRFGNWLRRYATAYDAVIVHGLWQFVGYAAHKALRMKATPYFIFPHGMLDSWFRRAHPLKHLKKRAYWSIESQVLADSQAVLFTADEEKLRADETFSSLGCASQIVPLGAEIPNSNPEADKKAFLDRFPHLRGKRYILFLGRLHPKKAPDLLIKAFGKFLSGQPQDAPKLVLGGPPCSATFDRELRRLVSENCPPGKVTFTGMLSGSLKWGAYHGAEAFILPSHQENFGVALVEALGCGLPALISNQVDIGAEIEASRAGFIQPDSEEGILRLLQQWLNTPASAREEMRASARLCYEQQFTPDAAAQRFIDALRCSGVEDSIPGRPLDPRPEPQSERKPLKFAAG
jgi:glycosyltransferase involved in cell wall biosynthesis